MNALWKYILYRSRKQIKVKWSEVKMQHSSSPYNNVKMHKRTQYITTPQNTAAQHNSTPYTMQHEVVKYKTTHHNKGNISTT